MKYCFVTNIKENMRVWGQFLRVIQAAELDEYEISEEMTNAKIIIPVGEFGLERILSRKDIQNVRGGIYEKENQKIIPIVSPEKIFKAPWYMPAIIHDLKRARETVEGRMSVTRPCLKVLSRPSELTEWFESQVGKSCAFDIETTISGGEWIKCIGFCADGKEGIVVPFPQDSTENLFELQAIIKKHMESSSIKWIGQNAYNFDIPYLQRVWNIRVNNLWIDTMVLHHLLYPEFPHDLATIGSFYTTIPYWKDQSDVDLYKYNAYDTVATYLSAVAMEEEAKKRGLWGQYENYYRPLLTPLSAMSMRGVRIDRDYQQEVKTSLKKEIKLFQGDLDEFVLKYTDLSSINKRIKRITLLAEAKRKTVWLKGKRKRISSLLKATEKRLEKAQTVNVRSTKDLGKFLYGTLGLPAKTKKGKITTDATALNQLFIKTQHPFLKTMIRLREKRNSLSRWGNLKTDENGMITTTYKFAETGRLRSGRMEGK